MADRSITASQVIPSSNAAIQKGTAGATITAGQPLYKDADTKELHPALNDTLIHATVVGIAANGASDGQPVQYVSRDPALQLGAAAGVAEGDLLVLSGTAGGICPLADVVTGDFLCVIGVGNSDGSINCNFEGGALVADAAIPA